MKRPSGDHAASDASLTSFRLRRVRRSYTQIAEQSRFPQEPTYV